MNWKKFAAEYLSFSRRERVGVISLIVTILAVYLLPSVINFKNTGYASQDTSWFAAIHRLETKQYNQDYQEDNLAPEYQNDQPVKNDTKSPVGELFYFDPNTASAADWEKLGIRNKTIHTIQNFISKGGKFWKPDDLKKIYGLFNDEYERLKPFIKIETRKSEIPASISPTGKENTAIRTNHDRLDYQNNFNTKRYSIIDINTADTTKFISLPGIGTKLAARIVNFRDKLGGFYSIEQLAETFGLHDSIFQKIKPYLKLENVSIKKININSATLEELKAHPYIRYVIANPLVAYRKEHGSFKKLEEIKNVMAITEAIYKKIEPYLFVE